MPIRILFLAVGGFMLAGCDETRQPETRSLKEILSPNSERVVRNFDPDQIQRGESVFQANCENCHGKNAAGTTDWRTPAADGKFPPPPLNGTAHAWHHSTAVLKKTILKGGPPEFSTMPAWEGILTEQEVDDVIVWIKSLWPDEIYTTWHHNFEDQ
ncbi:Cytochrome C oxidase, cbb3-type, subunit III [Nitrosomonas sp. Nm51]|uniref:c-type cytochrome n=1 Tax=Nitrosomonas sp. Nm51 TaxID=133720 RepID=UPI0008ABA062|nr:cytochrome c [Nitrosomonas sp. Nm51]SER66548.1 Cytochrome C oxidase, cbb3-type, subunit III [Nitrosomonas sp. Nm51]